MDQAEIYLLKFKKHHFSDSIFHEKDTPNSSNYVYFVRQVYTLL